MLTAIKAPRTDLGTATSLKQHIKSSRNIPRVLLVEDDVINQRVSQMQLDKMGCIVDLAINGQQAVFFFERGYDIVLMDIGLPDFDGVEAARKIRHLYPDYNTPIVAYTSHSDASMKKKCLAAGMNDFVAKPASFEQLHRVIEYTVGMSDKLR